MRSVVSMARMWPAWDAFLMASSRLLAVPVQVLPLFMLAVYESDLVLKLVIPPNYHINFITAARPSGQLRSPGKPCATCAANALT